MQIDVLSLSQEVSFEDGSVTNIILIRLPSGRPLRAVVSDEGAKALVEDLAAFRTGSPHVTASAPSHTAEPRIEEQAALASPMHDQSSLNVDGAVEFGGEGGEVTEAPAAQPLWLPPPAEPVAPAAEAASTPVQQQVWTDAESQARAFRSKQRGQDKNRDGNGGRPPARVQMNDRGYPMARGRGGVSATEVVGRGSAGTDEEGVGQI